MPACKRKRSKTCLNSSLRICGYQVTTFCRVLFTHLTNKVTKRLRLRTPPYGQGHGRWITLWNLLSKVKPLLLPERVSNRLVAALPTLKTRLSQRPKSTGAPTLLFVTSAALRVADVSRILKDKRLRGEKGGEVAKLFAKHIKLSEHVTYLRRTRVAAAPGTPGRIGKLLCETGKHRGSLWRS